MSLITQCPACATMFRVVPDQLRISEGWVRCGQCEEVFDANAHLRTLDEVAARPAPEPVPEPTQLWAEEIPPHQPAPVPAPVQAPPADAYDWGPVLAPPAPSAEVPASAGVDAPGSEPAVRTDQTMGPDWDEQVSHDERDAQGAVSEVDAFLAQNPHGQPADESLVWPEPAAAQAENSLPEPEHAPLSFMASGTASTSAWRTLGRPVLFLLCGLLVLLLSLQVLVRERDQIAAAAPVLRPLIASICLPLDCHISAPRQIDAIAIESSSFTSLKPGVYVLNAVLKNAAAMHLATPALELTLTDTQDQAVVRRVIEPAAFGGKLEIAAGAELSASIPVQVATAAGVQKIAGYKLLAFYP